MVRELYYIKAPDGLAAIYVKDAIKGGKMYYAHTDHQGSIVALTDSIGVKVFQASYDAWGKQSVSLNTIGFYRGYTGHEHLPEFGLINMNGRMYDPVLGRFLSPDNYVQAPDMSQNFNRFSYCLNNPLKYTDPSGEILPLLLLTYAGAAIIGGGLNVWSNWENIVKDPWSSVGYFASGAAGGAVSVGAPWLGGTITAAGNIGTDLAFGNVPKFNDAGDVFKYAGSKALDGLGAAGSGQLAKGGLNAMLKLGWIQNVTITGAAQITSSAGLAMEAMSAQYNVIQTAVLEPVARGVISQAAKAGGRGFFSGAGTEAQALKEGFQTLGKTDAGRNLAKLTADIDYFPGSKSYEMWGRLSTQWAKGASGQVHVFQNAATGTDVLSIWKVFEYPALKANPNITSIFFHY